MSDAATEVFEANRTRLAAIAYRMLGAPDDADDVVQDAWLKFSRTDLDSIDNAAGWLTTVVTRLSIDRLRSAQHRRETYVGPWLADPIETEPSQDADPDDALIMAESLSLGFLAVLERVSPLERAVFLLHDVFAYPLAEVADIIERTPAATRQLAKRARDHIERARPRFEPDPAEIEALTTLMMAAAFEGDVETLVSFLASEVTHISDGGPDHRAARAPIVGPDRVARFFINLAKRTEPGMEAHIVQANGQLAVYLTNDGEPFLLVTSNWIEGRVVASYGVRNPDKLTAFHRSWLARR